VSELWGRYKNGDSIRSIARSIDRPSSAKYKKFAPTGGIRPASRTRPQIALSLENGEQISRTVILEPSGILLDVEASVR